MPKIIGVDLDDVLMACNESLCVWHNANYGTSYTKKDFFSYRFNVVWGCTEREAIARVRRFFDSSEHADALSVEGAVNALRILGEENCHIITARSNGVSRFTIAWLERHFPKMVGRIHFVGCEKGLVHHEALKPSTCKKLGVDVFIDDSLVHARGVSAIGIPVLLFDSPWNQTNDLPPNVERVYSWDEIVERLK